MRIRTTWVAGLWAAALLTGAPVGAQECPPAVKAMAPQNGTITTCSYMSLTTTMSIEISGEVPRPGLPDQPYGFSVKVIRMKLESMARRKDMMAQAEMARMEEARASTAAESRPPLEYGPIESKAVAGGKAWYRKVSVGSIGESLNTAVRVHYICDYYVVDGMSMITFSASAPGKAEADAWLEHVRTRLKAVQ